MTLDKVLMGIRQAQTTEKTASAASAPATTKMASEAPATAALAAALDAAIGSTEKTAADRSGGASPVQDVMKVANEIAANEKAASVQEAQLLGTAFADSVVARLAAWNKVAEEAGPVPTTKTAGDNSFQKFASENPDLMKQAAELGYAQTRAGLEKMADDQYVAGYNDTVVAIHKTAAIEFLKAAAVTSNIIEAAVRR